MTFSKLIVRLFSCLSLVLAIASAFGQTATSDFLREVRAAPTEARFDELLGEMPAELAKDKNFVGYKEGRDGDSWTESRNRLVKLLEAKAGRLSPTGTLENPQETAKEILSGIQYRDTGTASERNWLSRVFQRIGEFIRDILDRIFGNRELDMPSVPNPSPILGALTPIVWGVIGVAVILFVIFVIRKFRLSPRRKKVGGLLEEDEPERTADEWLTRADELSAAGRHREAMRCLYLACLVRFDDANVARFIRSETNWEHLRRISASPKKPEALNFRPATEQFDLVWYGYKPTNDHDVREFRGVYQQLCLDLKINQAA